MYNLQKTICVVAGASSGIGREICIQLSYCGATVICAARRKEKLDETVELIAANGGVAEAVACDFTDPEAVEGLTKYVLERYKKIDTWVNGIGVNNAMGITWELGNAQWFHEIDGNLKTCYIGTKCAINAMKDKGEGRIINMSGGGVVKPEIYNSAYACSKTALVRFTECISLELQKENIPVKVFAFGPGLVRTERTIALANKEATKKYMPGIIDRIKNDEATPIERPAQFVAFIATGAVDELEGCLLEEYMDKEQLVRDKIYIRKNQLHKLCIKQ